MNSWRSGRAWVAALRRGWWIGALLAVLVALGAGAQYARAVRETPYVATQTLHMALLGPSATSTSAVAAANANAASIARLLASGGLLASPSLDAAIAARMRADDPALLGVTPGAVAAGLSATHVGAGGAVTLSARWPSTEGAEELLRTTVEVLQGGALAGEPEVAALLAPAPLGTVLQVRAVGAPSTAVPDADTLAAARGDLLARLGLGAMAGLLAAFAAGAVIARRQAAAGVAQEPPLKG